MLRPVLFALGVLLILLGSSGLYMLPKVLNQKIEEKMQIKIGTKLFDRFQNIPVALKIRFNIFNITNKEQVLAGLERPKFQEVGPFTFEERRKRHVVDIEDNARKIRFRETKYYYPLYDKWASGRDDRLKDEFMLDPKAYNITMVNLPLLSVLTKLANIPDSSFKRSVASKIAQRFVEESDDKILITRPANEILFDGYKVKFLEAANDLFESFGFNFDSPLPGNKFGFFFMKNGTWNKRESGEFVIHSGRHGSIGEFPNVYSWNDQQVLNVWPNNTKAGNRCNQIRGTDGSSFHPNLSQDKLLHVFSPLICTSIYFKFREVAQVSGIPVWRYTTPPEVFAAPGKNDFNQCYCTITKANSIESQHQQHSAINNSRCFIDGILDLSLCQRGAPIAASGAHFYNSDPMLAVLAGTKPDKAKHETYLDVEPMTGAVMRAASRAQLNGIVEQAALDVIDANITGRMVPMIAPLIWIEEGAAINDELANEFKGLLLNLVQKVNKTCTYSIITGLVLITVVATHYWYTHCFGIDLREIENRAARKKAETRRHRSGYLNQNIKTDRRNIHTNQPGSFRDEPDETYRRKSSLLTDEHIVSGNTLANAMGAIGANLPLSHDDRDRLLDDESDNDERSRNRQAKSEIDPVDETREKLVKKPGEHQPTTTDV